MSGTSMDGIDAALVRTNGVDSIELVSYSETAYSDDTRSAIRAQLLAEERTPAVCALEATLTDEHIAAVHALLQLPSRLSATSVDEELSSRSDAAGGRAQIVGFHGHTLSHAPERGHTLQIGDGQRLADAVGMPVAFDFRTADVAQGGQGAPLVPVFHRALAAQLLKEEHGTCTPVRAARSLAVVNIGGVSNVTYIDMEHLSSDSPSAEHLLAFDCGPGNAYMDDYCMRNLKCRCDSGGAVAASAPPLEAAVRQLLQHDFIHAAPPKSLDRQSLQAAVDNAMQLVPDDAPHGTHLATLALMTARCIASSAKHMPQLPEYWIVCGGGRHNATLMQLLQQELDIVAAGTAALEHAAAAAVSPAHCATPPPPAPVVLLAEQVGWRGGSMEAEAFAFLAVRCLAGLPLTFPGTTGVAAPTLGGTVVQPGTTIQ